MKNSSLASSLKGFLLAGIFFITTGTLFGQVPQMINYQAVARDYQTGQPLANAQLMVVVKILQNGPSGTIVYQETHDGVTTNEYGLFGLKIGNGSVDAGNFSAINWSLGSFWLSISVDAGTGNGLEEISSTQLLSVPYALYAKSAGNSASDADQDSTNELQTLHQAGNLVTLSHNGGTIDINDADSSSTNELQTLSQAGNTVTLSNGGGSVDINDADSSATNELITGATFNSGVLSINEGTGTNAQTKTVDLSSLVSNDNDQDSTNELQTLHQAGNLVTLSHNGGTIDINDADSSSTNELQTLSQAGNTVTLSNGGGSIDINDADSSATNELITGATFNSGVLSINEGTGTNAQTKTVDLSSLVSNDNDQDSTNELQTLHQAGNLVTLSHNGGTIDINDADSSSTNELQTLSQAGSTVTLSNGGGSVDINDADSSATNELITGATFNSGVLSINEGTGTNAQTKTVDLSSLVSNDNDQDSTNELQTLHQAGNLVTLSHNGGTIDINDADSSSTNELQTLSQAGNTVTLSNGGGSIDINDADSSSTNELITSFTLDMTDTTLHIIEGGIEHVLNADQLVQAGNLWLKSVNDVYNNSEDIGIGTSTPEARLEVKGTTSSNDTIFKVSNSSGQKLLNVQSNNTVQVGANAYNNASVNIGGSASFSSVKLLSPFVNNYSVLPSDMYLIDNSLSNISTNANLPDAATTKGQTFYFISNKNTFQKVTITVPSGQRGNYSTDPKIGFGLGNYSCVQMYSDGYYYYFIGGAQ